MENLELMTQLFGGVYNGSRVLVTGHTGFKGAWLTEWLCGLGAEVHGLSLEVLPESLFSKLGLEGRIKHNVGNILDPSALGRVFEAARPQFVFHMAAQPIVRRSYSEPALTFETNVMGTVYLCEELRKLERQCSVVIVTSDKCYLNREWVYGYRESDALGGHDPYSASKAATEIVAGSYRDSYFASSASPVGLATARAGNVIGGGDWSVDRIIPDAARALLSGQPIRVRNKSSFRPWQHVLDALAGYLWLGSRQAAASNTPQAGEFSGPFNFGPLPESQRPVSALITEFLRHWPGRWEDASEVSACHEAKMLHLAVDKARTVLGWSPTWAFEQTVFRTAEWYRQSGCMSRDPGELTRQQIWSFAEDAKAARQPWATANW